MKEQHTVLILAAVSILAVAGLVLTFQGTPTGQALCNPGEELRTVYSTQYVSYKECMPRLVNVRYVPDKITNIPEEGDLGYAFETVPMKKERKEETLVGARTRPW